MSTPRDTYPAFIIRHLAGFTHALIFVREIMENPWDHVQLPHLMQRIILLYHLNHTPEEPSDNWTLRAQKQIQAKSSARPRTLSLRHERRIAEAFVLLAANSDDPRRIMAACVQEGENGQSMTVKLAVNSGELERVQKRLKKMGDLLQQLSKMEEVEALQSDANRLKLLYLSLEALTSARAKSAAGLDVLVDIACILRLTAKSPPSVELDPFVLGVIQKISNTPRGAALIAKAKRDGQIGIDDSISHASTLSYPVHAEMQLLLHYEGLPSETLTPRIICSNKQACFLCNLFFKIHERFLIPNSHGRLYEKWALPTTILQSGRFAGLIATLRTFDQEIVNRINREIQLQRKPFKTPYESTIFPSAVESVNTFLSLERPQFHNPSKCDAARRDSVTMLENSASSPSGNLEEPVRAIKEFPEPSRAAVRGALELSLRGQETLQETKDSSPTLNSTAESSAPRFIKGLLEHTPSTLQYQLDTAESFEEATPEDLQVPNLPYRLLAPSSRDEPAKNCLPVQNPRPHRLPAQWTLFPEAFRL
ncbi:hypothetical protein K469DRAFT_683991 [Zopfia rhizophila CBS 207.26]|uniref:Uncharacterized protein n=1 Tax=Zopfia rhizophila CBS 207.26 TaxID=1314779 RepID=A0A6A6DBQ2_9PEZI|nr:hypothetical protein K469DRAFT_683991 [Zopfia rhizophila CBS 207.26]